MLAEVAIRDEGAWAQMARSMSRALRDEIRNAPTGRVLQAALADQVTLITSLPIEAGERVHKLTLEGLETGARADTIAAEIMRTSEVTQGRANLIARTEVSRTVSSLTQARAEHVGSTGYIWRTSQDSDVRPSHKKMSGKFVLWSDAPTLDGLKGHAGALPNCRCFPEPVIPDIED
jgi:SPP1 gp7 family putative phage head morphogenesis protein